MELEGVAGGREDLARGERFHTDIDIGHQ
jgi:hypothetical protein